VEDVAGRTTTLQTESPESYCKPTDMVGAMVRSPPVAVTSWFEADELPSRFFKVRFDELVFMMRMKRPSVPPAIPVNVAVETPV